MNDQTNTELTFFERAVLWDKGNAIEPLDVGRAFDHLWARTVSSTRSRSLIKSGSSSSGSSKALRIKSMLPIEVRLEVSDHTETKLWNSIS